MFYGLAANAQFSPPSQMERNQLLLNPAYAGSLEATVASIMYRNQWAGWDGSPVIQNFEMHAPLKKQSMALGFQAYNESAGLKNRTDAFFTYAYRIQMDKSKLAFALKGGIQNRSFKEAETEDNENDPAFTQTSTLIPNVGFGVSYYNPKYFVGLSIPYFFGANSDDAGTQLSFDINDFAYILTGGGSIDVGYNIALEPIASFYYSATLKTQLLAVLNAKWNNMVRGGIGYRMNEGLIFNVAYLFNQQLSVAVSYDLNTGDIAKYSNGSFEIGAMYFFGYKVNTVSPRDF